jgi:predicted nucleotidyltransferase component of viral defense system
VNERLSPAILQDVANDLGIAPLILERDWVLTEIIFQLALQLGPDLILKGGQALRHVYGSARFSKDADYVAMRRLEFDELRASLHIRYPTLHLPTEPAGRTRFGIKVDRIGYVGPMRIPGTVELEISFREQAQLPPQVLPFLSPFRDPFPVTVLHLHEIVAEKMRALYQRGNPRDLYDLWFILIKLAARIDPATVAGLIPIKFRLVSGGWRKQQLYDNIEANSGTWDDAFRLLVVDPPAFEETLVAVQRALRPVVSKVSG